MCLSVYICLNIYIYIYIYIYTEREKERERSSYQIVLTVQNYLITICHLSQLFITPCRSSKLHSVSVQT